VLKAFGGGMRQAGVLAAAGLIALTEGPGLLTIDHARARRMATELARLPGLRVEVAAVESNILMVDLTSADASALLAHLGAYGVRALAVAPRRVRFVTHRDLSDADIDSCLRAVDGWARAQ
jgi:threonine aldolase